jgi:CHAT domain-containing protein/Tfp pilus assembly protein PilF
MKCKQTVSISIAIIFLAELVIASTAGASDVAFYGVLVESVRRNCAVEKGGLRNGDILLAWRRGDEKGEIYSSFDIGWLEMEHSPRGMVTFTGLRQSESQTWVLGQGCWGIETQPQMPQSVAREYRKGLALARAGRVSQAVGVWTTAARQQHHSTQLGAWFMFRAASLLSESRRWNIADRLYEESIMRAARAAPSVTAQIFLAWARSYRQRGDWADSEKYCLQSMVESRKIGEENLSAAETLDELGTIFLQRRNLQRAEAYFRQALDIREKLAPDSLVLARSLSHLGTVIRYPRGGDLATAEQYYNQALSIQNKRAPGSLDVASTLTNLGIIAWQRGDLMTAEKDLRQALEIGNKLAPNSLYVADSLNELGNVTDLQGDSTKGEKFIQRALAIRLELEPQSRDVAESLTDIASIAEERGQLSKAEQYQQRALNIDRKLAPDGIDIAGDLNNLGYVARDRGNLAKSEQYHRQALAIERAVGSENLYLAETLHSLGDLSHQQGRLLEAENRYTESLGIREKLANGSADHAATLAALAWIARKRGQLANAQELYERALNALESQTARLAGSEEVRSSFRALHAGYYKELADLLIEEKQPELALQTVERSRARMLLEMMTAAHVDIRQGVDPQLLERERNLQAELNTRLSRRIRILSGPHSVQQLLAAQKDIEQTLVQHKEVEEQIRASSPRYSELTEPQPLTIEEIQGQILDRDTLLLEYSIGAERGHVWVVDQDSVTSYELPSRAQVDSAARLVYRLLTEPNRVMKDEPESARAIRLARATARYSRAALALSRMVLGPVAQHLSGKRLLVVADGALQYIPFTILPVPRRPGDPQRELIPLVAEHEIVNLPSVSVLAALRRETRGRPAAQKAVAVLADPVFDKDDVRVSRLADSTQSHARRTIDVAGSTSAWSSSPRSRLLRSATDIGLAKSLHSRTAQEVLLNRLWFTRLEADTIVANTHGQHLKAVDFRASRETATNPELAQYSIVHFATHGLLDSQNPELSGLVFSMVDPQGRAQNGFLDLQDIYNLNLPVEMVVLSACETGLGKEIDGEGLLGLTRGFMFAGASRVVASLWRVSDVATAELMGRFYRALGQDGIPPAAALRTAQIEMMQHKRWSAPYYWAGFEIQGEWK